MGEKKWRKKKLRMKKSGKGVCTFKVRNTWKKEKDGDGKVRLYGEEEAKDNIL